MISQTHYLDLDRDLEKNQIIKFLIVQKVRSISDVEYWTNGLFYRVVKLKYVSSNVSLFDRYIWWKILYENQFQNF